MTEARKARRENGLQSTFSTQTDLRNEISELQRLLNSLGDYQTKNMVITLVKALLQDEIAMRAEELFSLTAPEN